MLAEVLQFNLYPAIIFDPTQAKNTIKTKIYSILEKYPLFKALSHIFYHYDYEDGKNLLGSTFTNFHSRRFLQWCSYIIYMYVLHGYY